MRFQRNYKTAESTDYWNRLDKAIDEIRYRRTTMNLTYDELRTAQLEYTKDLVLPAVVNGVSFYRTPVGSLEFRYKNATGLIFADNGYLGPTEDKRDYYLLWRLSCSYNKECKYNPTFSPGLQSAAKAVKESWRQFCSEE